MQDLRLAGCRAWQDAYRRYNEALASLRIDLDDPNAPLEVAMGDVIGNLTVADPLAVNAGVCAVALANQFRRSRGAAIGLYCQIMAGHGNGPVADAAWGDQIITEWVAVALGLNLAASLHPL